MVDLNQKLNHKRDVMIIVYSVCTLKDNFYIYQSNSLFGKTVRRSLNCQEALAEIVLARTKRKEAVVQKELLHFWEG